MLIRDFVLADRPSLKKENLKLYEAAGNGVVMGRIGAVTTITDYY
jgi:hypothetical protein